MIDARLRKNLDYSLIAVTIAIVMMGLTAIFSATKDTSLLFVKKQALFFVLGLFMMVLAASIDYGKLTRITSAIYGINIVFLIVVKKFSAHIKGASRWITLGPFQFQPSELAKIILIICLSFYLIKRADRIRELPTFLGSLAYIGVPWLLIFAQPDLGTSLVILAIWFGMTFIAGAKIQHLVGVLLAGIALFSVAWKFDIIKPYQKLRLMVFINPQLDPMESGYHVIQSRIAIGSGQTLGKGLLRGTQTHGKFIPENHTDFIFTVIGEEGGFLFSSILVGFYGLLLFRGFVVIAQAEDLLGKLIATGIVTMYGFHITVNVGMTIGIMPITGVPLPLLSYGGSSILLNLTSIGLLLGIGMRKHRLVF